jgi:hypothetical protein
MKNFIFLTLFITLFTSCNNETHVETVDKHGSIELEIKTQHEKDYDVLITKRKIWKNQSEIKTITSFDTIPALDSMNVADDDGSVQKIRDAYEIFITVQ